jgi:hypothetical protein
MTSHCGNVIRLGLEGRGVIFRFPSEAELYPKAPPRPCTEPSRTGAPQVRLTTLLQIPTCVRIRCKTTSPCRTFIYIFRPSLRTPCPPPVTATLKSSYSSKDNHTHNLIVRCLETFAFRGQGLSWCFNRRVGRPGLPVSYSTTLH